jgi:hypothetical protein
LDKLFTTLLTFADIHDIQLRSSKRKQFFLFNVLMFGNWNESSSSNIHCKWWLQKYRIGMKYEQHRGGVVQGEVSGPRIPGFKTTQANKSTWT